MLSECATPPSDSGRLTDHWGRAGSGHPTKDVDTKQGPGTSADFFKGDARDQAGKTVGVSGELTGFAAKVLERGTQEYITLADDCQAAASFHHAPGAGHGSGARRSPVPDATRQASGQTRTNEHVVEIGVSGRRQAAGRRAAPLE